MCGLPLLSHTLESASFYFESQTERSICRIIANLSPSCPKLRLKDEVGSRILKLVVVFCRVGVENALQSNTHGGTSNHKHHRKMGLREKQL